MQSVTVYEPAEQLLPRRLPIDAERLIRRVVDTCQVVRSDNRCDLCYSAAPLLEAGRR